jgi:branched-chain amino acid transport system substrate-binding protein
MKNFIIIFMTIAILNSCSRNEDVVKIGAILPLTGSAAIWGQNVKRGIDLAKDKLNSMGGVNDSKIVLLYEDSEGKPEKSVSAFQKIFTTDKPIAIIGDVASSSVLAMAPLANRNKIVILSPGASNPDITNAGDYVFRNWHSDAAEGSYLAEISLYKLHMKKIAIIYVNNGYGKGLENVFSKKFTEIGGQIVESEAFEQGATDFRSQLTKIKAVNPDGIFLPGYPKEIPEVLKQSKSLNVNKQFLCPSAFEDQQTLDLAGNSANGVIYDYPKQGDTSKSYVKEFYSDYFKKYNISPGALSDNGYDALMLIVEAIKIKGMSREQIKEGLYSIKDYPGVAGNTTFDENGDIKKEFILKTVKNQKFIEY